MVSICYVAPEVFAASEGVPSIGGVAENILEPAIIVAHVLHCIYLIIGVVFIVASIIKFFERRINPLGVTLGQILFLFVAGLLMLGMPYFFTSTGHGFVLSIFPMLASM